MFRPDAHGGKHRDGLGGFGKPAQKVKAFARQGGVRQAAFFGQCGECQKAAAGADEAGQQGRCGQCVGAGVGHRKGLGDGGVEHEVERDVQKAARVGGLGQASQSAFCASARAGATKAAVAAKAWRRFRSKDGWEMGYRPKL